MPSKLVVTLAAMAAWLLLAGCATTDQNAGADAGLEAEIDPKRLVAGERALAEHRYRDAAKHYRHLLEGHPDHPQARLGLAEAHLGLGEHDQAAAMFGELSELPETRVAGLQGKGIAHLMSSDIEAAQPALLDATAEDPLRWRAWNALARTYDFQGDWAKAAEAYRMARDAAPNPALIHNNWGVSYMARADYAKAEDQFRRALELEPTLPTARANLRLALAAQTRYAEALSGVDDEARAEVLNNVGYVALLRGDYVSAEAFLLQALEASPSFYAQAARNLQLLGSMRQIQASAPPEGSPDRGPTVAAR